MAIAMIKMSLCSSIDLHSHQADTSLSSTTVELLTSFSNCIVYVYDEGWEYEYEYTSAEHFQLYSETVNCAVIADSWYQLRNKSARNPRFQESKPHPLSTRNTQVLINLYSSQVMAVLSGMVDITNCMWDIVNLYNIPFNYVMIFMTSEEYSLIDNTAVVTQFVRISSPAVYMLILDQREVNVICFVNALRSAPYLFRVTNFKATSIQHLQKVIHKDFQGAIATIKTLYSRWESCEFGALLWQDPSFCTINLMAESLNITFLYQEDQDYEIPSVIEIQSTYVIDANHLQDLTRRGGLNFDVVNLGIFYREYSFLCVAQTNQVGLMAFLKAYDLLTWIATAIACLFLSVTIAAMTTQTPLTFWLKFQSAAPVVLMLLLERFYGHSQVIRAASQQLVLVISLWAFGAMLLGMGFSGNMVSQLTSPSLPPCPKDMEQLAGVEEYPVLTATIQMSGSSVDTTSRPFFHNQINDYVTFYGDANGTLVVFMEQFGKKLVYVNDKFRLNPLNYKTSTQVLLAYAGLKEEVRAYGMWSVMRSNTISVLIGGNLPYFTTWEPFFVQSNFLGPVIRRFLAGIFECGISNYWADIERAEEVNSTFEFYSHGIDEELQKRLFKKSKLAAIMRKFGPLLDEESSWGAMSVANLSAAFLLVGVGFLLSGCVMLTERCPWKIVVRVLIYNKAYFVWMLMNPTVHSFASRLLPMAVGWVKFIFRRRKQTP